MNGNIARSDLLSRQKDLIHGSSSRDFGNMSYRWGEENDVTASRQKFFRELGVKLSDGVMMICKHGTGIGSAGKVERGAGMSPDSTGIDGDCLLTDQPGVALCLLTADCVPMMLYDPDRAVIALVHLGWRGTDQRLAELVVTQMIERYGTDPANILVWLGPCIKPESYIFDEARQADDPAWAGFVSRNQAGQYEIDLVGYNTAQLVRAGVDRQNIESSPIDTAIDQRYFSHYQSIASAQPEGRLMSVIAMRDSSG